MSNRDEIAPKTQVLRESREVRVLRELGLVFEPTMSLDEILTEIVNRTTRLIGADRSTLYLMEPEGGLVSRVIEGEGVTEICLSPGQGIAGWAAQHSRPLMVSDAYRDERFDPTWDKRTGFTTRSIICCPILSHRGVVIGVIEVLNKADSGVFNESDHQLLGLIAGQLALTIENSKLMVNLVSNNQALVDARQMLHLHNREITLLLDIEERIAASDDLDSLFMAILSRTLTATHAEICLLYRFDDTGAEIRVVDQSLPIARVIRTGTASGFGEWVADKGQEINLIDPSANLHYLPQLQARIGVTLKNLAGVPLEMAPPGRTRGALFVQNKQIGEGFDEMDMGLLRLVAQRLNRAIAYFSDREERERERRLATVGRLLAGVLHDIKSPMSIISGYAELLAEKAGDSEAREYLIHLNRAVERITKMAEEIIAFSRGESEILLTNELIEHLMDALFKQIDPLLFKKKIALKTHVRTGGIITVDREKMLRVFYNLALNAVEAMEEGGVLTVEADRVAEEIVFSFTDTGMGIPEEIRGSVFQSFVTMGKRQGTGLGLAVAREIVEAHHGTISFNTIVNKGTTFIVSIPVK